MGDGQTGIIIRRPLVTVAVGQWLPASRPAGNNMIAGLRVFDVPVEGLVLAPVVAGQQIRFVAEPEVVEATQLVHAVLEVGGPRQEPVVVRAAAPYVVADTVPALPVPCLGADIPAGRQVLEFGSTGTGADDLPRGDVVVARIRIISVRRIQADISAIDGDARS